MLRQALAVGAVTALLIAGSTNVRAVEQEELPFADARTYFQIGGTNGIENFDIAADSGVGFNLRYGKRVAARFAVEAQFDWMTGFDRPAGAGSIDLWTLGANTKYYFLTDRVQPFLLLGIGGLFATGNLNGSGFMGRFGAGLDVYATERIGISLETAYVLPTVGSTRFDNITISWSLFYRFDNEDD